jgi:hypothetical protein
MLKYIFHFFRTTKHGLRHGTSECVVHCTTEGGEREGGRLPFLLVALLCFRDSLGLFSLKKKS